MATTKLGTEMRREQITLAALTLISQRGLTGFSVADLAERVGLVPSAIYRHFKSKDEVVDAALDFMQARMLENVRAVAEESSDPLERLRLLLHRHARMIRETMAIPRIVFAEELYVSHPERKAKVLRILRGYLDRVAEIIRRGQAEGRLRDDVEPATAALMLIGLVQPAGVLWSMSDGRFDIMRHARNAWRLYADSMRARRGGST